MVKFLIVRFSSIGDIVLTTPVIRCLKNQVEDAEVHYLTKKTFSSILAYNPYIDKMHFLEDSLDKVVRDLKKENYDYIIDLHHNLRTSIIKARMKPLAFSFNKLNIEKWLMVNFKVNRLPGKHIVDRYLDTIRLFDIRNDGKGLEYFIDPADEINLADLPETHRKGYAGFVIGAKHNTKKLPKDKIIAIIRKLELPVILLGGKEDREAAEFIRKQAGDLCYNACGLYNLGQSASLVRQANVIITHDTGLMHIAAAFKKKIISIWGNTIPEFGMYPYEPHSDSQIFEVKGLKCRPCSKIGYQTCPKKHFKCMNGIDVDQVAKVGKEMF
ncbi:MAG TPA: glycosyltransferase family 9 protein [Bacteroidales bacterium]